MATGATGPVLLFILVSRVYCIYTYPEDSCTFLQKQLSEGKQVSNIVRSVSPLPAAGTCYRRTCVVDFAALQDTCEGDDIILTVMSLVCLCTQAACCVRQQR
jgi:hypothetical protein